MYTEKEKQILKDVYELQTKSGIIDYRFMLHILKNYEYDVKLKIIDGMLKQHLIKAVRNDSGRIKYFIVNFFMYDIEGEK